MELPCTLDKKDTKQSITNSSVYNPCREGQVPSLSNLHSWQPRHSHQELEILGQGGEC